jgi:dihydroflavonol-4-reductase
MLVAVTGAAGHVGGNLVRALSQCGCTVRAIVHRDRRALEGVPAELVTADVRDRASLQRALSDVEVVYHAAAYISLDPDTWPQHHAVNVVGTRHTVDACLQCGVRRLVHFSSIHAVEQEPLHTILDESRPLASEPFSCAYDRSKSAAEMEIRRGLDLGLDAVTLCPTAIIGPCDYRPSHTGQAILSFARGSMPIVVQGGFDWVDVRDVVEAAIDAQENSSPGSRYMLSGHWVSLFDLARRVAMVSGARPPVLALPLGVARAAVPALSLWSRISQTRPLFTKMSVETIRLSHRQVSHALATQELGYVPRPFEETILDIVNWFAEHGLISLRTRKHGGPSQ